MSQNKYFGDVGMGSIELGGNSAIGGFLTNAVASGKALADDGNLYDSVQTAVNNASGIVVIGPGTFNERVGIDTAGLTLIGSGYDTLIDGGTQGNAVSATNDDVTISNLSVKTTAGGGNGNDGVYSDSFFTTIKNVTVRDSDQHGISIIGGSGNFYGARITNCLIESVDEQGVKLNANGCICINTVVKNTGIHGIRTGAGGGTSEGQDCIISSCIVQNSGDVGILADTSDIVVIGCRVISSGGDGINLNRNNILIANNRISDSASNDITNSGSGSVFDDNLTGSAN